MGRELKRVPLDFDAPINVVWIGYIVPDDVNLPVKSCDDCNAQGYECNEAEEYCFHNPETKKKWYYDPPKGKGFQLWETTSEGSPISPVFKTLDKLCEFAAVNCPIFADNYVSKEEWKRQLNSDNVEFKIGNAVFI